MKKIIVFLLTACLSIMIFSSVPKHTNAQATDSINIGYCEGEEYYEFDYTFNYLILALEEAGLIGKLNKPLPIDTKSRDTWAFLQQHDQSDWHVKFVKDAFFSFTDSQSLNVVDEMFEVVQNENVDIMLALGTNASLEAKELNKYCGVVSLMAMNPLESGIVNGLTNSNIDNVWALIDTNAISRSIAVMYDIFEPKTVGIVYGNGEDAYIYSGANDLDKFASEIGLDVRKVFVDDPVTFSQDELDRYKFELLNAFEKLSKEVDVFVMTPSLLELDELEEYFAPFYENKVPVYSISGSEEVKFGALMAVEISNYRNIGRFVSDVLRQFMLGGELKNLPQVFESAPFLSINYNTARLIGYKPSFDILLVANDIFN